MVSGNYFAVLGVKAAVGRTILPEEDQAPGSHPVAVLSHEIWKRQFHSDPSVVGKMIKLNGEGFTVVGVAPEAFKGTSLEVPPDIWLPLSMEVQLKVWEGKLLTDRGLQVLSLTGRLKPGVTLKQAEAAMNTHASHRLTRSLAAGPSFGRGTELVLFLYWDFCRSRWVSYFSLPALTLPTCCCHGVPGATGRWAFV